ncbi:hypothetical protein ABK040_004559 [Willaertia magna]
MTEKSKSGLFSAILNYFENNNSVPLTDPTPTLIASVYGRKVFGLSNSVPTNKYRDDFYYNVLPFKVKEIKSAGGNGEYFCYWTIDDKLLFSGFIDEKKSNYLYKYNVPKENKYLNENMKEIFEFKWKDFVKNKISNKIYSFKQIYLLNDYCIIIHLENDTLFYYYLNRSLHGAIPVNNVKWIKGGIMSSRVYIYTNLNELYSFEDRILAKVNLGFLQDSQSIRLAATTNGGVELLVTKENKIYTKTNFKPYGISHNVTAQFEYRETPFEKQSKIIDVKGGFSHFVVLLKNKTVYSIGYNNLGQLGEDQLVTEKTYEFKQIILKTRENIQVDQIYASSRGTVLRTDNEFIFLGEVIQGFTKNSMIPNIKYSYILKREESNRKWNAISCGPWSYLVYFKEEENSSKDLTSFLQNLKNYSFNVEKNLTHDIEIKFRNDFADL